MLFAFKTVNNMAQQIDPNADSSYSNGSLQPKCKFWQTIYYITTFQNIRSKKEWIPRACCRLTLTRRVETEVLEIGEAKDVEVEEEPQYDFCGHEGDIVSRLCTASPKEGERYYLQRLLLHVLGAKCCEDICTIDVEVCATIRKACSKRGLLADDELWKRTLRVYF